jgi:glycine/D-amino acid oxidase-like deaminating enzyme
MNDHSRDEMTWYEATRADSPGRPRLTFDLDVDVCVIGGGLAGLTTAREVARRGWSVAVIEANRIGWAASGRNSGFVLPGFSESIDVIVERIGLDHAKQLWALSEAGATYVRDTIHDTGMAGVDPVEGWLKVSKTDDEREALSLVERLRWIGAAVEAWPVGRVRDVLASQRYFNAVHFPRAFHVHPLNYALGLATAAEAAGARIFEDTPAVAIDAAGVRKRVQTSAAMVRAAHVVLAGNVHLGSLIPRLAATLLPVTAYAMVSEPIENLREVVRYGGAVSDGDRGANHFRIVDGNRLLWNAGVTMWQADPRRYAGGLAAKIRRILPQLGKVAIAHVWSGTLGRAVHRMPQIGEIQRGLWVASAFGGHGLNTTAMAGELIAHGIVEADQTWRLFAPYELVWAGGRIGQVVAQTIYAGSRPVAEIHEALARYRERARVRGKVKAAAKEAAVAARRQSAGIAAPDQPDTGAARPRQHRKNRDKSSRAAGADRES